MMKKYDVSALIATYQPEWEKLKRTICSFLLQEGVEIQIVVTDDGSEEDFFDKIEHLFQSYHFEDYSLVKNPSNLGTVKNLENGLKKCTGKYLKPFSPGDYLIGKDVLQSWCKFMESNQLVMSGSNYVCYSEDGMGKESASVQRACPRVIVMSGTAMKRNYLLNNDIFVGASTFCDTEIYRKYLGMISGSVKYAEDLMYRIMAYCNEKIGFYNEQTILYEYGTGISTSGENKWKVLLDKDWSATNQIILSLSTEDAEFKRSFYKIALLHDKGNTSLLRLAIVCLGIKGLFWLKLRRVFTRRYTAADLPEEWLKELKSM